MEQDIGLFSIKNKNDLYQSIVGISELFEVRFVQFGDKTMDVYENYIKLVKEKTNELRELANELERKSHEEFKKVQKEMVEYASPSSNVKKDIIPKEKKLKKKQMNYVFNKNI